MDQNNAQKPNQNRSASQKITDLENALLSLYNLADSLTKDFNTLRNAMKLLNNKVNSMVKASVNGEEMTDAVLERIMVENNCEELAQKVTSMVSQGIVAAEEQVSENSFIVGSEIDDTDKVINPRLQFALKALPAELQAKLLGTKAGDTVLLEEGKLKFKVLESYKIQEPKLATEVAAAPAEATAEAPAAPEVAAEPAASEPEQAPQ